MYFLSHIISKISFGSSRKEPKSEAKADYIPLQITESKFGDLAGVSAERSGLFDIMCRRTSGKDKYVDYDGHTYNQQQQCQDRDAMRGLNLYVQAHGQPLLDRKQQKAFDKGCGKKGEKGYFNKGTWRQYGVVRQNGIDTLIEKSVEKGIWGKTIYQAVALDKNFKRPIEHPYLAMRALGFAVHYAENIKDITLGKNRLLVPDNKVEIDYFLAGCMSYEGENKSKLMVKTNFDRINQGAACKL